ncbi:hypothetical protein PAPYR_11435 [Paratrimastix pyriformis]|uniref:Uncharacterized protein n=1 Tax=Paratrimastix pyriformis TaxID=342808 RepID=A0ABQ8U6A6_9EUKA|nr:hypothetical protein PAPYR_11435 [Paratrimastix pyriformis]
MLDEFCKLFGHLVSGALPSSTLLKGIIESLQKGCSPAVSRDRIAVWIQKLLSSFMWQCYLKYRDDAPPSHSRHSSASSTDDSSDLQLRQNVSYAYPSTLPAPASVHAHRSTRMQGRFASPLAQEGCAYGGDLHTCPGGDAALPPPPPAASVPAPGGMEGDQGCLRGSPCPTKPAAAKDFVVAREHYVLPPTHDGMSGVNLPVQAF